MYVKKYYKWNIYDCEDGVEGNIVHVLNDHKYIVKCHY